MSKQSFILFSGEIYKDLKSTRRAIYWSGKPFNLKASKTNCSVMRLMVIIFTNLSLIRRRRGLKIPLITGATDA